MALEMVEEKVVFHELINDVEKQAKRFPKLTKVEIINQFFSEKHEIALRFHHFHHEIMMGGLSQWRKNGFMKEDFDILFEYSEKGYAQGIRGFDSMLSIFECIRDLGSPDKFRLTQWVKEICPDCDGTGGTYVDGKCSTCNGSGRIPEEVVIAGEGEEQYANALDSLNEKYYQIRGKDRIQSFEEFINRLDEEEVNIEKAIAFRENDKKLKPDCKLIGEDGNVFNLLAIVSRTLKRHNMKKEAEEMEARVFDAQSYDEALQIFMEYVDVY